VASIAIPGGHSLRPVKNRGKVLTKLQIKTSPYFHWQNTPLTKLPPYFSIYTFKNSSIFYFPPIFHWSNYTLNKTFFLEGKKPKIERKTCVRNWGNLSPKLGEVAPDFDSKFEGIEATVRNSWLFKLKIGTPITTGIRKKFTHIGAVTQLSCARTDKQTEKVITLSPPVLTKQPHRSAIVQSRRLSLFGHIARMPGETDAKQILTASPAGNWRRPMGRPRIIWMKTIQQGLKSSDLSMDDAVDLAQNRPLRRLMSTFGAMHS